MYIRNQQCRVLYSNVRGLHGSFCDMIVISKRCYYFLKLVSDMRHGVELSFPGFKRPILLKCNEINHAQGMVTYSTSGMVVLPLIRPSLWVP